MRLRFLALALPLAVALAACGVDTTGLSAQSSRTPRGNASALVTVTEYGDIQCPACKSAHELINKPLMQQYGQQVKFEFMHFPLQAIHPYAFEAAQASECAADQGKFWEFVDLAYERQKDLSSGALRDWATALGLDKDLFDRCVRSGIKQVIVNQSYVSGEKMHVSGTPTYFVNNQKVPSNMEAIAQAINAAQQQGSEMPL